MATSAEVPARFPVAINGHGYMIDTAKYQRESLPVLRQQSDTSDVPSEASLNPRGPWRRSAESWHHGAGQKFQDGKDPVSDPSRFLDSDGIDCWTPGQLTLLPIATKRRDTNNTNLKLAAVGTHLYVADGQEVYWNEDPSNLLAVNRDGFSPTVADPSGYADWFEEPPGSVSLALTTSSPAEGGHALRLTQTSGTTIGVRFVGTGTGAMPVTGPDSVESMPEDYFSMRFKKVTAGSRTVTVTVYWYGSGGALLGSATESATATNTWSLPLDEGGARPAGTAFVSMTATIAGVGAGEQWDLDSPAWTPWPQAINVRRQWTSADIHAGQAAQTVQSITTDGTHLWAALGSSGLHRTNAGALTSTADVPSQACHLVGYALGRLLIANAHQLWEVLDPLGSPTTSLLMSHPNTGFVWSFISPGRNVIYAGGNAGGNAEIYKVTLEASGANLGAPSAATYLPDGESIHDARFYAGGVILATGLGVRVATADGSGNIDYGPLIKTKMPVLALEPQDRYVWFGMSQRQLRTSNTYSAELGRLDLGYFTEQLIPAWAPDLVAEATSIDGADQVTSIVSFAERTISDTYTPIRFFAVDDQGVYGEMTRYQPNGLSQRSVKRSDGWLASGLARFGTTESKTLISLDVRHRPLTAGSVTADYSVDETVTDDAVFADWVAAGTSTTVGATGPASPFDLALTKGEAAAIKVTLNNGDDPDLNWSRGPTFTRYTLRALPTPARSESFLLPIILRSRVQTLQGDGDTHSVDVGAELAFLKALERSGDVVDFQVGQETLRGYVEDTQLSGEQITGTPDRDIEGTMMVRLITL